jgi:hypothetical protein
MAGIVKVVMTKIRQMAATKARDKIMGMMD